MLAKQRCQDFLIAAAVKIQVAVAIAGLRLPSDLGRLAVSLISA
jgi:hypothetical protein